MFVLAARSNHQPFQAGLVTSLGCGGGSSLATLAAIFGHNNLRSVNKYVHRSEADQFRAMERLEAIPAVPEQAQASQVRWTN